LVLRSGSFWYGVDGIIESNQENGNMSNDTSIEFINIRKSYGTNTVLDGLNMTASAREHVVIIGPSGSGKSTILKLLMTLEKPDSGEILIDGENLWHTARGGQNSQADPAHLRHMRSKVGMVFQHFNLFPHLRVLQNITEAPVRVLAVPRAEANQRARELLDRVGLADKYNAWPAELSGGQKQRVAIARALALQPRIMLFDEITSALDPEIASQVLQLVLDLARQTDMTMLFVTHQMRFARQVADRVVFFDQGKIVEQGAPNQVLENPAQTRTREFLSNILMAS
jgi:polar amino acid transport system ATP-binding protein